MIKVCVIGGGAFGTNHLRAFKQMERKGEVKLLALADVNEEILKKQYEDFGVKGYTDFHKMLDKEKPDAVSIATPDHLHKEIALEVIERGLPLLVEKPLDLAQDVLTEYFHVLKKRDEKILKWCIIIISRFFLKEGLFIFYSFFLSSIFLLRISI